MDPQNVPEPFRALILYAEKWGINDYTTPGKAIDARDLIKLRLKSENNR